MPAQPLPATIGRYEIVAELGRGAMGRVFRARDPNVDRHVALKVLAPLHLAAADEAEELRRRFILEARAAGRLSHPGIVMVLDADADPATGSPYIAMELVAGCLGSQFGWTRIGLLCVSHRQAAWASCSSMASSLALASLAHCCHLGI